MKAIGFIISSHYILKEGKPVIHLFGRFENGKSFHATIDDRRPYFFIKAEDKEKFTKETSIKTTATKLKTLKGEAVVQVTIDNPKDVPPLRSIAENHNIACYEADIPFTQRFLIDNNILSAAVFEGEELEDIYADIFLENPKITPTTTELPQGATPTILSFDIETDSKAQKILSVSIYTKEHDEVIVVQNDNIQQGKFKDTTVVEDEKELIELFLTRVKELDPDILTGWNVIDFDVQVFAKRCKTHNIPFVLGRTRDETTMRLESSFFRDSHVNIKGRTVLDGIQLLKWSLVKLDDYKLNTAAKEFLGETKLIQDDDRWEQIEENYWNNPKEFIEYNRKDSVLVYDIIHKAKVFELTMQRSLLTGMHMDRVKASIASFDSLYLRGLRARGHVAASTRTIEDEAGLGGFVHKSKPGIYTNVLVLDFKTLYPTIMQTFNIDPLSYQGSTKELGENLDPKKFIIAPNGAVFTHDEGVLTQIINDLGIARERVKKEGNKMASFAIKTFMASLSGVLASQNCRFHIRNMSNAITYFAQHFIKLTAQRIRDKGYEVIYGDTDSVFVDIDTDDTNEAIRIGKELEKDINTGLKEHITNEYHRESRLTLEFEKTYKRFFMPAVRGDDATKGSKKRYAGLLLQPDGSTQLDFTGLEFVRRDWTDLAKTFQMQLLDLIFAGKDADEFIRTFVADVRAKKYDDQLVYRKALRKSIDSYTKTTPPHVKAAALLDRITSKIITYVLTLDGPQPVEKQTSPIDYDHYIEKQIKPIAESLLLFQHKKFDDVVKGSKQKGLGEFF